MTSGRILQSVHYNPNNGELIMSNEAENALAGLGLDLGDAGATAIVAEGSEAVAAGAEASADAEKRAPRKEVEVGEIVIGEADELPELKRLGGGGGRTGSKYPFDKLSAPVTNDEGKTKYSTFFVAVQEGVDPEALKRSVQSAATAANRQAKNDNTGSKFETRSKVVDGKFVGMTVYRTA